jgi:hypothetical protein
MKRRSKKAERARLDRIKRAKANARLKRKEIIRRKFGPYTCPVFIEGKDFSLKGVSWDGEDELCIVGIREHELNLRLIKYRKFDL